MGIRGVNLGNWLVLEKWMGGSPLSRAVSPDDRGLVDELDKATRYAALNRHFATYIDRTTFAWLASKGVDLVRIPVPYWLFGTKHHPSCVTYLDKAFEWAEEVGIGILVDLHTVPMGQNGFDNGGYLGMAAWHRDPARINATLDLLEDIARRYAGRVGLWGIEPLNEPLNLTTYLANLPAWMGEVAQRARKSRPVPRQVLKEFYQRFYDRVRPLVGPEAKLVFHDHFSLRSWERWYPAPGDDNVWIDTHQYVAFADTPISSRDLDAYLGRIERWGQRIAWAEQFHHVLVGEWSLANHAPGLNELSASTQQRWYRALADAQLNAWDRGSGSCFWSLRTNARGRENWSFEDCVCRGWLDLRASGRHISSKQ